MVGTLGPIISFLILVMVSALSGILPIKKMIQVQEAKHELKHGSPGFLRSFTGMLIIFIWFAATWFFATIIGDWYATGDLSGAIERSGRRLEFLLRILAALADD